MPPRWVHVILIVPHRLQEHRRKRISLLKRDGVPTKCEECAHEKGARHEDCGEESLQGYRLRSVYECRAWWWSQPGPYDGHRSHEYRLYRRWNGWPVHQVKFVLALVSSVRGTECVGMLGLNEEDRQVPLLIESIRNEFATPCFSL